MATPQKNQTVTIKTDEQNPEPIELIAKAIIGVSDAFDKINKSQLRRRVVLLLLQDAIPGKIRLADIESVLEWAPRLKSLYLKQVEPTVKKK